jgi:protein-tyrosine phosphatase/membrane-associated phospholipid phosphatase
MTTPPTIETRPSKWMAAATSGGLSLLFIVVYGSCNWITAHRTDVGTWYYGWERYIPFVPLMIVPYMSIDLFFVAAPFLCRSRIELKVLAQRIAFAIIVAGGFFLAMPLKMGTPRPEPSGWTGTLFALLYGFDEPTNLFPSLHIALRTILAVLYARHTRGPVRIAVHVWFSLIGFSTLLTWQHHFVDIVGGFVLAAIAFYVFRENQPRIAIIPNYRIGAYYAVGALAVAGTAAPGWPWTGVLLWPALSLAIVAVAYAGLGPAVYRKTDGRLPFSSQLLLAPCLLGQYLSLWHYRRQCRAWDELTPRVWIGAKLSKTEAEKARRQGVTAVLDLTSEFSETRAFLGLAYQNIPVLDLTGINSAQLQQAVEFTKRHAKDGVVYIHCKAGYSRTAAVAGAWLIASGGAGSAEEAMAVLCKARPSIVIRPEARLALEVFDRMNCKKRILTE